MLKILNAFAETSGLLIFCMLTKHLKNSNTMDTGQED